MDNPVVEGFDRLDDISHANVQLPVFVSQKGTKPIIVLHELPGMTKPFIRYCRQMVENDYKVYMPLLFAKPGTKMGRLRIALFCLTREFRQLFTMNKDTEQGRAFPRWLLYLTNFVVEKHSPQDVGVIGMCLTGGFAIAAIANKKVSAVASCQPAYPLYFGISTLGLTEKQRDDCANRCKGLSRPLVKGYRYEDDGICREEHMQAVQNLLGDGFERFPDLKGDDHSTVTEEDNQKNEIVYNDILKFLADRLS